MDVSAKFVTPAPKKGLSKKILRLWEIAKKREEFRRFSGSSFVKYSLFSRENIRINISTFNASKVMITAHIIGGTQ